MSETILTIIFVLAVTGIITYFSFKKKNSAWKGTLIKKRVSTSTDEDGFTSTTYKLVFKKDDGKKARCSVKQSVFDTFFEDRRYEKVKGEWLPKEIQA